jgi:hypothetical protein
LRTQNRNEVEVAALRQPRTPGTSLLNQCQVRVPVTFEGNRNTSSSAVLPCSEEQSTLPQSWGVVESLIRQEDNLVGGDLRSTPLTRTSPVARAAPASARQDDVERLAIELCGQAG